MYVCILMIGPIPAESPKSNAYLPLVSEGAADRVRRLESRIEETLDQMGLSDSARDRPRRTFSRGKGTIGQSVRLTTSPLIRH